MKIFALVFALALAAAAMLQPAAARAGELDLTGDFSTFSSLGDVYGPWRSLTATYRWVAGADTPGIAVVTRVDADYLAPTHSDGLVLDDYHTWSPKFFTYAAVGASAGDVLPTRNFYFEGDEKFGHDLATVFGGGVGVVVNPNGIVQRYFNVGPTYYSAGYNVTLRYLQTFTTGRTAAGTGIFTFQTGATGRTIGTLSLVAGSQPPNSIAAYDSTIELGQRIVSAGIGIKHWMGPSGGILAGFTVARLNDRMSGDLLYVQRDITLGFFHNIGPALP